MERPRTLQSLSAEVHFVDVTLAICRICIYIVIFLNIVMFKLSLNTTIKRSVLPISYITYTILIFFIGFFIK